MRSLDEWIRSWPRSKEVWSIHVDELTDWQPTNTSHAAWVMELVKLWALARRLCQEPCVVIAALSFEASDRVRTFKNVLTVPLDVFTPPSLYLLNERLGFPAAGEQYYRILTKTEFEWLPDGSTVIARSARSVQALANNWEFDNTLYVASKFGE